MEENYIVFDKVTKSYGVGAARIDALKSASFAVNKGEFCVILGSSGAGKTTLLNILGGMDTATEGSIRFSGREVASLKGRELVNYRRHEGGVG